MANSSYQKDKSLSIGENSIRYLYKEFDKEYLNYYKKQVVEFQKKYPDITNKNRRTGKSLKNICFFIWHYTDGEKGKVFDLLFDTSVLLSAQDDFLDNPQIDYQNKEKFHSVCKDLLNGKNCNLTKIDTAQLQELISLWKTIIKKIKNSSSRGVYLYWKKTAEQMNEAMKKEVYLSKNQRVAFDDYIKKAVYSIGAIFIWTTYLIIKKAPISTLEKLKPIFLRGAIIARFSNDICSYRKNKNKINAVNIIMNKKNSEKYILGLIRKEKQKLNKDLEGLQIEKWIKQAIQRSTDFLIEFYKNSDFTKTFSKKEN
ncbi:hypothetical protein KAS79_00295 [Candidatus Parcubacteria bacterium]|nr:hypothetical protein [Candidatus Parcubacteria bacterium]